MTSSAWWMLGITWTVIILFTASSFLKVVRTPPKNDTES